MWACEQVDCHSNRSANAHVDADQSADVGADADQFAASARSSKPAS